LTFLEKELSRLPYADQETNSDLMMPVASLTMRLLLPAGLGFELHSFDCNRRALGDGQPNRIALLLGSSQIRVEHEGVHFEQIHTGARPSPILYSARSRLLPPQLVQRMIMTPG
jgi:hypothetical protein